MQDLVWNESRNDSNVLIAIIRRTSNETSKNVKGILKIKPFKEKSRQRTGEYRTEYLVMGGAVSVKIDEDPWVSLEIMDSFTIAPGTLHAIRNTGETESILYFDVSQ